MGDPKPSFHPSPSKPKLRLPAGACDAHVHVFGPHERFPFAADRPFTPADAPKEKLFALHAAMGIERCVIGRRCDVGQRATMTRSMALAAGSRVEAYSAL